VSAEPMMPDVPKPNLDGNGAFNQGQALKHE